MDTTNYGGPKGKIPKELQGGEITQNSESIVQSSEGATAEENEAVSTDMNWNIAEQLTEERNCRAEFEAIITMFMDSLVNQSTGADALRMMSFQVYEIVQRLHKGFGPGKISPALQFCNALVKVLSTIKAIDEEVSDFDPSVCWKFYENSFFRPGSIVATKFIEIDWHRRVQ